MSLLTEALKLHLTKLVAEQAIELKQKILTSYPKDSQRRVAFGLVYCFHDFFNLLRPKLRYTKFIGRIADPARIDYHELDLFIVSLVETFFKSFGTDYKSTYNFIKTMGWITSHVSIGHGNLPGQFWTKPMSSDDFPIEKLGKFWYIVFNFKW